MVSLKQTKFMQSIFYSLGLHGFELINKITYLSDKK